MAAFVTKDGAGAEVRVETGTGTIVEIKEKGPNASISVKSSLAKMEHPVSGWVAKDDPLYAAAVQAQADGREIEYRIEQQRKRDIPLDTPIEALRRNESGQPDMGVAKKNTNKIFAMLDNITSAEAVTNPKNDPAPGGRVRDTDNAPGPAAPAAAPAVAGPVFDKDAALAALATARATGMDDTVVGAAAALALMAGATAKQVNEAGFTGQKATSRGEVRRAFAAEAPPHVEVNSDGRANVGSYAVLAMSTAERFARGLLADAALDVFQAHNAAVAAGEIDAEPLEAPEPVNPAQSLAIAKILMEIADHVQVGAYGGGRPNRMANSHTRARAFVFDAVKERHPVPFGASPDEREAWRQAIIEEEIERLRAIVVASQAVATVTVAQGEQPAAEEAPAQQSAVEQAGEQPAPEQAPAAPQSAPEQAPAAATERTATVTPVTAARSQAAKAKVKVEGDEGFEAPSADVIKRFGALVSAAGYEARQNSPVQVYLMAKTGVSIVRQVHGPDLEKLIAWFESKGEQAGDTFRQFVEREVAAQQKSA